MHNAQAISVETRRNPWDKHTLPSHLPSFPPQILSTGFVPSFVLDAGDPKREGTVLALEE